jgi:exoribonuclease R
MHQSIVSIVSKHCCTLVHRRLDMLPSLLSEQLCSLLSGVERYAVSAIWTFEESAAAPRAVAGDDHEGVLTPAHPVLEQREVWFGRTIIRSRHQLHYQQAQVRMDGWMDRWMDELTAYVLHQSVMIAQLHTAQP